MGTITDHEDMKFKVEIPWELHQAIIRIQAEEDLPFTKACLKAAMLVDPRREQFKKAVKEEADRLGKSRFMGQVNKARKTIEDNSWQNGAKYVRSNEDNFRVPCSVCGKHMRFSSDDKEWEDEKKTLYKAFGNWYHTMCKK